MRRWDEFNTRLENLVGVDVANTMFADAENEAYSHAAKMGATMTEQQLLQYESILDRVLKIYETEQQPTTKGAYIGYEQP